MRIAHFCKPALCLSAALTLFAVPAAHAAYIITVQQSGSDVDAIGSGSLDVTDLTLTNHGGDSLGAVSPGVPTFIVGPNANTDDYVTTVSGPATLGPGVSTTFASSGSGPIVAITRDNFDRLTIAVPYNYVSGAALSTSTDTFSGQSLSTLGLSPGTYTYTWGTSPDADSLTVQINAVPEPASLSLLALAGLPITRRRRG